MGEGRRGKALFDFVVESDLLASRLGSFVVSLQWMMVVWWWQMGNRNILSDCRY